MNNNPIFVIDSGVGGLSCLENIIKAMPNEDIIYFADTLNMPYGNKSKEELCVLAKNIAKLCNEYSAKMIIIACGTISSNVMDVFYKECPNMLVQGIIEPSVSAVSRACSEDNKIGVIATCGTIKSNAHKNAFEKLSKKLNITYKACDKLAAAIESNDLSHDEMNKLIASYVDELVEKDNIDTLLLACTHYPLVIDNIKEMYPEINIIDPSMLLSKNASILLRLHEFSSDKETGSLKFMVSKKTDGFKAMVSRLGFDDTLISEVPINE